MTSAESDGINEMVEGAHRSLGTGVMRWVELTAWQRRDAAYDRAGDANREAQAALAQRDIIEGYQARLDTWDELQRDRRGEAQHDPELPAGQDAMASTLPAGERVDHPLRAQLHARAHAALDGRAFIADPDVEDTLRAWAADRDTDGEPIPADSPHWRQWALLEATDDQLQLAYERAAGVCGAEDRLATALHDLQDQVEEAAKTDSAWRKAADTRARIEAARILSAPPNQHWTPAAPTSRWQDPRTKTEQIRAARLEPDIEDAVILHDLTFAAPAAAATTAGARRRRPGTTSNRPLSAQRFQQRRRTGR